MKHVSEVETNANKETRSLRERFASWLDNRSPEMQLALGTAAAGLALVGAGVGLELVADTEASGAVAMVGGGGVAVGGLLALNEATTNR